jgi:hypothetical protein
MAKLDTEQIKSYKAGELYVTVHSEANKGGEIRAQIIPCVVFPTANTDQPMRKGPGDLSPGPCNLRRGRPAYSRASSACRPSAPMP